VRRTEIPGCSRRRRSHLIPAPLLSRAANRSGSTALKAIACVSDRHRRGMSEAPGLNWRDVDLAGARAIFWGHQIKGNGATRVYRRSSSQLSPTCRIAKAGCSASPTASPGRHSASEGMAARSSARGKGR
jgi:hypothetical protein